jgi:hypothetical protein
MARAISALSVTSNASGVVVVVTPDLTARFSAVDLMRVVSAAPAAKAGAVLAAIDEQWAVEYRQDSSFPLRLFQTM